MNKELNEVLGRIGEEFKEEISAESTFILEVDIGKKAEELGYLSLKEQYHNVDVIVPLRQAVEGMKVMIDGRTFVDYAQFDSGLVVPGYVAKESGLPHRAYEAQDSLIRNFA
jgi:hypothetical protein